jgi:hypothetical protein
MEEKSENISIPLSYTFSFINALLIIYTQICLKSKNNQERLLKFRIFLLIAVDSFIIAFKLIYYNFIDEINYEIINTFLFSLQFYESISFLFEIFQNILEVKETDIISPFVMSFISFLSLFPYSKFLYSYTVYIFVIQIISRAFCIICLYYYLNNIIENISNDEDMSASKLSLNKDISILINTCLNALLLYNLFQFGVIYFNNFYYDLIIFALNIGIKYIVFALSILIITSLTNFNFNKNSYENNNDIVVK